MSIEIYGSRFRLGLGVGIPVDGLSRAFAGLVVQTEPGAWLLDLAGGGGGGVYTRLQFQTAQPETPTFALARPVDDPRLFQALYKVLQLEGVVVYAPGSPPVLGHPASALHLPADMAAALGPSVWVDSARALRSALLDG